MQLKYQAFNYINKGFILFKKSVKYSFKIITLIIDKLPKPLRQKINQNELFLILRFHILQPPRNQRVYVRRGIEHIKFLELLNQRNVEYVLLRTWEQLPDFPHGEDINILVKDEHRTLINDLVVKYDSKGIKCDIYTVHGSNNGSRMDIPVFPYNLSQALMKTRVFYNGAYVPSPFPYFASVAYHSIFHKGHHSGVPGFGIEPTHFVYDYSSALKKLASNLGINVDMSVTGLYAWLKKEGFAPANDTLTKLIQNCPELSILEEPLFCDARGGELLVYIIREQLFQDGLLEDFKKFLEDKYQFDIIDIRVLNSEEQKICSSYIRGGKWDNGPFKYSGGIPAALIVAFDYHPWPLGNNEQVKQPRVTDKNSLEAKYVFRERVNHLLLKGDYNGVHSADNEQDAWLYISLFGEAYSTKILNEVENRRKRYAMKWAVKKLLSTGPLSKVELIQYKEGLAIKKTYRPGKEKYSEKELFATKELSKELDFIPSLLEEGDGYVILPYLENVLDGLLEKKKKRVLLSKK